MSDELMVNMVLYSPGSGCEQSYELRMNRQQMTFKSLGKIATCVEDEYENPIWSGHREEIGKPIEKILHDALIYPPAIFIGALEYLWDKWKSEEISDDQARA